MVTVARRENSEALTLLRQSGLRAESPTPDQLAALAVSAETTRRRNVPDLYSEAWLTRVEALLADYRAGRP
jgi:hypothetical protein